MIKKYFIIVFILNLIISFKELFAQDPHFSQFNNNLIYVNPAFVGIYNGLNVNLAYRRQWPAVPGKFENYYFGMDKSLWIMQGFGGVGLNCMTDVEGEGMLKTTTIALPFSSRIQVTERLILQVGVMPSFLQVSVDWSKFIFSDQLNPYYGAIYATSFSFPGKDQISRFDIGVGGILKYETYPQRGTEKFNSICKIGFAVFHVNSPNISLTGLEAPLPKRYVFYLDYTYALNQFYYRRDIVKIHPAFLYEYQNPMSTYTIGLDLCKSGYNIGIWFRNKDFKITNIDALIFSLGYSMYLNQIKSTILQISYSYDLTLSKLRDGASGCHELMLIFKCEDFKIFSKETCEDDPGNIRRLKRKIRK